MTKGTRTIRDFSEIAELIAAETMTTSDSFSSAFEAGLDSSRIGMGEEELTSDMPDATEAQLATEMLVRTMFDVLRDTRMESIAGRLAWGIVHSFHKVAGQRRSRQGDAQDQGADPQRRRERGDDGRTGGSAIALPVAG